MKVNPRDSANLNVRRGWTDSCCQGNGHIFVDRGQMTRVLIADDAGDQRALYVAPLALAGFVVDAVRGHLRGDAGGDEPSGEPLREIRISKPAPAPDPLVNPAAPGPRAWLSTIAAAVALAISITLGPGSIGSVPRGIRLSDVADMSIDQHQKLGRGLVPPQVTGVSHRLMERWFRQRVDFKVVLPNVKDPKVTLVGGRMSRFANAEAAAIEYQLDQHRVSLFIVGEEAYDRLALGESPRFKLIRQRGYDVIIWRHGATGYTMVSEIGVRACRVCHAPDETFDGASLESFVARL